MDPVTAWLRTLRTPLVERLSTALLARLGLGAMLVLAGIHKLLDPAGWTVYVTDWLAPSAAVAAVSLPATVAYLAVVAVTDGLFVDILIRDVGLAVLAWVVLLDALEAAPRELKE